MFETCNSNHQAEKTRLLLSLPFFFRILSLVDLIFYCSLAQREPLNEPTSLDRRIFLAFQAGPHIGRQCNVVWF